MKAYTDLNQSKKLAEILPIESAEHHYVRKVCDFRGNSVDGKWSEPKYGNPESSYANYLVQNFTSYEIIPCWSLAALLDTLPSSTLDSSNDHYYRLHCMERFTEWYDNAVDACYEMIIKLHELNLL
jgi:hypothetical protein